mmetsp:Transcript_34883/g.69632  ORF Transcript_34883/g.69632 Transcript_34883/m.69632 type:complete len:107 (-) Transcript_34883:289-609(-)
MKSTGEAQMKSTGEARALAALIDGICLQLQVGPEASRRHSMEIAVRQMIHIDRSGGALLEVFEQAAQRWRGDPLTSPPIQMTSGLAEQFCHLAHQRQSRPTDALVA